MTFREALKEDTRNLHRLVIGIIVGYAFIFSSGLIGLNYFMV